MRVDIQLMVTVGRDWNWDPTRFKQAYLLRRRRITTESVRWRDGRIMAARDSRRCTPRISGQNDRRDFDSFSLPTSERQRGRCLSAAAEARAAGHGGIAGVARAA